MLTVEASVCIDAPVDEVWARLARLEDIRLWSEAVVDAYCDGPLARLLEPLFRLQIRRIGTRTLAAFKYLVEQGEPPQTRHAKLAAGPATC